MKNASDTLINMLKDSSNLVCCDLYTIILSNGLVLRITSADKNIKYKGNIYDSSLLLKRDDLESATGINVDTLSIIIYPKPTNVVGSITYHKAFRNGTFDGAVLQLDKAFFTDWESPPEVLEKLFIGQMEVDEVSRTQIKVNVNSFTQLLNISLPRNVYQASCPWMLFDSSTCKVNKENFTYIGTITEGSTILTINSELSSLADGYFEQGVILFLSGDNINIKRTIKKHLGGKLVLSNPLQYPPNNGDTFSISRGCDGTMDTCRVKFNNLANFGGQPFVPEAESTF